MIRYLLEVSICWAGFYGLYYALLSRTTFFAANRWYLLGTLLLGLVVPLLELPVAAPAGQLPVVHYLQPISVGVERLEVTVTAERPGGGFPLLAILTGIYWLGVMLSAARLLYGVGQIARLYRRSERRRQPGGYVLALTDEAHLPFTFFHVLFWSRRLPLADEDGQAVLRHEQAHIRGRHTLDVLLLEGLGIVFWCSPFVYLYRRSLRTVHEYLADQVVLRTTRRKTYGHLLLRQSQSGLQIALANHFIRSQLKKRILMMSRKNTHRAALVRYLLAAPLLVLFILLFAGRELIGQTIMEIRRTDGTVEQLQFKTVEEAKQYLHIDPDNIATVDIRKAEGEMKIDLKDGTIINVRGFFPDEARADAPAGDQPLQVEIIHPDGRVERHVLADKSALEDLVSPGQIERVDVFKQDAGGSRIVVRLKGDEPATAPAADKLLRVEIIHPDGRVERHVLSDGSALEDLVSPGQIERVEVFKEEPDAPRIVVTLKGGKQATVRNGELPLFPGCEEESLSPEEKQKCSQTKLVNFIARNIVYPTPARTTGIQGNVVVQFTIDETGTVRNPEVMKGIGGGCDEEALRVLRSMPRWTPATKDGKPVSSIMTLPISFRMEGPQPGNGEIGPAEKKQLESVTTKTGAGEIFRVVEEMPRFPGCENVTDAQERQRCADRRMLEFIYSNIKYPGAARDAGINGVAVVQFVIDTDGRVVDPKMVREIGGGTSEEVLRVVQVMNEKGIRWIPGRQKGKEVKVQFNLPIKFALSDQPAPGVEKPDLPATGKALRLQNLVVAPNPTSGQLRLRFQAEAAPTQIQIADASGRLLLQRRIDDFSGAFDDQLDLSRMPAGVLTLIVRQGELVFTEKIVRQ